MLDSVMKYPEVREFLSDYPRTKWRICIDSIFLFGLHTLQRDYDSLSIPELIKLSDIDIKDYNLETSYKAPSGSSRRGSKATLAKDQETQTTSSSKKPEIIIKDLRSPVKNNCCQTVSNLQIQKFRPKELFPPTVRNQRSSDVTISEALKEPKTCPIESAKNIMRNESYDGVKGRNDKKNPKKEYLSLIESRSDSVNQDYWLERYSNASKDNLLSYRS
ncbi:hypothetical protein SteCoe_19318 [Stentor coeruleus]|uniref:Uncharacterized protein n=1 Tax=Stentor coeruleus TaxID=5963 RepID=A0A1R2BUI5_9CILI|nr:hypothetical protein SteCoe_19318 [Stentor coeruleus]